MNDDDVRSSLTTHKSENNAFDRLDFTKYGRKNDNQFTRPMGRASRSDDKPTDYIVKKQKREDIDVVGDLGNVATQSTARSKPKKQHTKNIFSPDSFKVKFRKTTKINRKQKFDAYATEPQKIDFADMVRHRTEVSGDSDNNRFSLNQI